MPSTITHSCSRISRRAAPSPITEGIFRLRPSMAVWLVGPPISVAKPSMRWSLKWMVSAADRSWAMRMMSSSSVPSRLSSVLCPIRFFWMRSTTWSISCLRWRRYSSSISSNCWARRSVWILSAHSALICCSSIISMGSRDRVASVSSIRCSEMNAPSSVGAFSGMLLRMCSSCLRVVLTAVSKRVASAGMSPSARLICGTSEVLRRIRWARPMAMPLPAG